MDTKQTAPLRLEPLGNEEMGHVLMAKVLAEQGRYAKAIGRIQAALRLAPDLLEAYLVLADIYTQQQDWERAKASFLAVLRLAPTHAQARFGLGGLYARERRIDDAIRELRESLRLDPQQPLCRMALGHEYLAARRYDEAIEELEAALRLDPKLSLAHLQIGDAYREQGLYDDALVAYREALRLDARMAAAHLRVGDLCVLQDRPEAAIPSYEAALMFNPLLLEAHWRLGRVHAELGRPGEAARHFRAEAILLPQKSLLEETLSRAEAARQEAALYCDLGNACAASGDVPQAMQAYQRAVEIAPTLLPRTAPGGRETRELTSFVLIPGRPALLPTTGEPPALTVLVERRNGQRRNGGGETHEGPIGALGKRRPIERRLARVARVGRGCLVLDAAQRPGRKLPAAPVDGLLPGAEGPAAT